MISAEPGWPQLALYVACRRSGRILVLTLLAVCLAFGYLAVFGARYTASLRMVAASEMQSGGPDGRLARDQAELLRDPGLIRRVLPALKVLKPSQADPMARGRAWLEQAARGSGDAMFASRVARALQVRALGDTDVIELSFTWNDRVFAAEALNAIVGIYQRSGSEASWAQDGVRRAQARVDETQAELDALAHPSGSADAEGLAGERGRIEARLAGAQGSADKARLERALAQRRLDAIEQTFKSGGWVDGADAAENAGGARPLAQGFATLLEKRGTLLTQGLGDSAEMRAIDREIARSREQSFASARQIVAGRIAGFDDRLGVLTAGIADDEASLRALDRHVSEADVVDVSRRAKGARLADERRALEDARSHVNLAWQAAGGARVLSDAQPPVSADWPSPVLLVFGAAVGGLLVGIGSAVLSELLRRTIDRPADIPRRLGIEVLARLSDYSSARQS